MYRGRGLLEVAGPIGRGQQVVGSSEWVSRCGGGRYKRRVSGLLCPLLTHHNSYPAYEDGTDRVFRNVGIQQSDAGEIPKRIHTRFKTRRKFEIKNYSHNLRISFC